MSVQPVTAEAPDLPRLQMMSQAWHDLTFLHWAVSPEVVAPFLPSGTVPDTLDGVSYVGLIGFRMVKLGDKHRRYAMQSRTFLFFNRLQDA